MNWFMLTLVGEDRPGIVAKITATLFQAGCNLGEATMARLGGNFTVMLMVQHAGTLDSLHALIDPVARELGLHAHADLIEGHLHRHLIPDVRVTVYGADRSGIVAQVTGALTAAGFNILDLQSDVGGSEANPVYIMTMEGQSRAGIEALEAALAALKRDGARDGIEVDVQPIETLIG
ncbi:MAG: ACT domain-containing protein [Gammaproteobacteria bacterium]|nr:ACT domain-containing protein [Gammaproteobacteria bacterium]